MKKTLHKRSWFIIAPLVFLGAFILGRVPTTAILPVEHRFMDRAGTKGYLPSYAPVSGDEIVMVYIGSSTCGFANGPDVPALIERTKLALRQEALSRDATFSAIGVSIDWNVDNGLRHLSKFGLFDEIMTGRKWLGQGGRQYFWESLPSTLRATPQVIVVARTVTTPTQLNPNYSISNERVLVRKTGIVSITNWLEQGTPLPKKPALPDASPLSLHN